MADATPAGDVVEGQEPEDVEGQEPGGEGEPDAQEGQGRTYTEAYVKQLRREAAGLRTKLVDAEERLQEREDADKSELERATERATAAEQRAADAETRLVRFEVAAEHGLDLDAAKFLTGSTREEIELRAEELGKLLDTAKPTPGGFDGGARKPAPAKGTPEEEHNRLLLEALGRGGRAS